MIPGMSRGMAASPKSAEVIESKDDADASSTLAELRRSFASVLTGLGGTDRAIDLAARLSIDKSLAWKVWRTAQGPDALPSPKHIPGRAGVAKFLKAAERAGVAKDLTARAEAAHARLTQFARTRSLDRASADILLNSLSTEGRARLDSALRRDAFRANSAFLGVQASLLFQMDAIVPGEPGFRPDVVRLRGHIGLRRMRRDATWVLSKSMLLSTSGLITGYSRSPLEPSAGTEDAAPLVRGFCSGVDDAAIGRRVRGATVEDILRAGPLDVGMDIVTGERFTRMPRDASDHSAVTMRITTPCERACFDLLMHESVCGSAGATLDVFSLINTDLPYAPDAEAERIPVLERVESLGRLDLAPPAVEVPHHQQLTRYMLEKLGRPAAEFRCWRVRMKHPPIPSCLALEYPLPARQEDAR